MITEQLRDLSLEVIGWLIVEKLAMTFSQNFWFFSGWFQADLIFESGGCIVFLCQLSALGFPCFFTTHHNIFFLFWGMFFTIEIEESLTLPWIRLRMTVISFRGGCRTLPTYDVAHCVCENLRYWEWFWIICTWKFIVDVSFLYWYAANTENKCYKMFITFKPSFDLLNLV